MRRVFTVDIDDVIAQTGFIPIMERTESSYYGADLIDPYCREVLWRLDEVVDIYYISSRSFRNATDLTREWMDDQGLPIACGVMCGIIPTKKSQLVNLLHATYHFDDDPMIVNSCGSKGVLVEIAPEGRNTCRVGNKKAVKSWREIESMCYSCPPLHIAYAPQQGELFNG